VSGPKLVSLDKRRGAPSLNDIPAMLRALADDMESGRALKSEAMIIVSMEERDEAPVLYVNPIPLAQFQRELADWLAPYTAVHLVADWPEDIAHFCNALITGPGQRLDTPALTMEVRRDLDEVPSAIPHNALAIAQAIRQSYMAKMA